MENQYENYVQKVKEVVRLFPQASRNTLKAINDKSNGQVPLNTKITEINENVSS